jgi:hypothetical protein
MKTQREEQPEANEHPHEGESSVTLYAADQR